MAMVRRWRSQPFRAWLIASVTAAISLQAFTSLAGAVFYPTYGSSWDHICDSTVYAQCVSWHFAARSYEYLSLTPNMVSASDYAVNSVYNPLDILYVSEPGNGDTGYFDADYGTAGTFRAWTSCSPGASYFGLDSTHTRDCVPDDVSYNLHYSADYDTTAERRGIACHETGHVFGLRHNQSTSSCMHNMPGTTTVLIQGEKDLLNGNY